MPALFGTLDLGARSLQTQQRGVEVAGHNIANVNNPAYARQRVEVQTSTAVTTEIGPQGTGADSVAIVRLRSEVVDNQIQTEAGVMGYLESRESALSYAEAGLGQSAGSQSTSAAGTAGANQSGMASALTGFFNGFQSLSTAPASETERQVLLSKASDLASRFNSTDQRLSALQAQLDGSVKTDTASANELLSQIAALNDQISRAENGSNGLANDLRDVRQGKIESLSKILNVTVAPTDKGSIELSIGGTTFVSGATVTDTLETYDLGSGHLGLRATTAGTAVNPTSGSIAGTIDTRDGEIGALRTDLNTLAANLIDQVNTIHRTGYDLKGNTGADFFTGTGAADIRVNASLIDDPSRLQASGAAGNVGDNAKALALAQLAEKPIPALGNQTFSQQYTHIVGSLGQAISTNATRLSDQQTVQSMLETQRASVSGVSLDEEMTNMMKFQKAFEASARLISIVDQMLSTVVNMAQ